jgi:hypothetical protein
MLIKCEDAWVVKEVCEVDFYMKDVYGMLE